MKPTLARKGYGPPVFKKGHPLALPKGFKFVRAEKGGTYDAQQNTIGWFVGSSTRTPTT